MKEYGILMTPDNIRKIIKLEKTQTRRVIEKIDKYKNLKKGDMLYIQEKWRLEGWNKIYYHSDNSITAHLMKWENPLFMPKWVARHWLRVKRTWVEHIQDIDIPDIIKEGIENPFVAGSSIDGALTKECFMKKDFIKLWNSINAKRGYSFEINPRVRVLEFEYIEDYKK